MHVFSNWEYFTATTRLLERVTHAKRPYAPRLIKPLLLTFPSTNVITISVSTIWDGK